MLPVVARLTLFQHVRLYYTTSNVYLQNSSSRMCEIAGACMLLGQKKKIIKMFKKYSIWFWDFLLHKAWIMMFITVKKKQKHILLLLWSWRPAWTLGYMTLRSKLLHERIERQELDQTVKSGWCHQWLFYYYGRRRRGESLLPRLMWISCVNYS